MAPSTPRPQRDAIQDFVSEHQGLDRVRDADLNIKTMLQPVTTSWNRRVPMSDVPKLIGGATPSMMEDRWVVCTEGPDDSGKMVVNIARSWTGFTTMRATVQVFIGNGAAESAELEAKFTQLVWESSRDRYRGQGADDAKTVALGVLRSCLGVQL